MRKRTVGWMVVMVAMVGIFASPSLNANVILDRSFLGKISFLPKFKIQRVEKIRSQEARRKIVEERYNLAWRAARILSTSA